LQLSSSFTCIDSFTLCGVMIFHHLLFVNLPLSFSRTVEQASQSSPHLLYTATQRLEYQHVPNTAPTCCAWTKTSNPCTLSTTDNNPNFWMRVSYHGIMNDLAEW
jgi:hypothetical protein